MKPIWIIENIVREKSFLELSEAAKAAGFEVHDIRGDFAHADLGKYWDQCVIFNGSIEMCKLVAPQLTHQRNAPNIYCSWDNYLCSHYYPHFAGHLFNDLYVFVPLVELNRRKYEFYGNFGRDTMIFVRPDTGDKSFKGGLVDLQDFDDFYKEFEHLKHELVLVSTPKNILGEWRIVVAAGTGVIASSCYRFHGKQTLIPSAPVGAEALATRVALGSYTPDPVFCVDIAQDSDGKFWILELTSFSSAGLYACDKAAIVKDVSEIAEKSWQLSVERR